MSEVIVKLTSDHIKVKGAEYVQELVRCKDCRHREKYPCDEIEFYECGHLRLHGTKVGVKDDWFCADGEREGE